MLDDSKTPLLLGIMFLETTKALIDVGLGELIFRLNKEKVVFNVFRAMKLQKENPQCYIIDIMEEMFREVATK